MRGTATVVRGRGRPAVCPPYAHDFGLTLPPHAGHRRGARNREQQSEGGGGRQPTIHLGSFLIHITMHMS